MGKIKGWKKISNGHLNGLHEWQHDTTLARVLYHPYGLTTKYKLKIETREGIEEGIVSNKHSANFGAIKYMRSHPNG